MMLRGKNAIITGARRGIGKSMATAFAQNGANIWACLRCPDEAFEAWSMQLAAENDVWIQPVYFDLAKPEEISKAVKSIMVDKQPVDILVNNAAMVADSTSFVMTSMAKIKEVFEVNFFAQMQLTQLVARLMMRKNKGSIINIASIAGIDGNPAQLEYVACKAAMIGATKKLAFELGNNNLRVNAIAPGVIDTEMGHEVEDTLMAETLEKTVMKRLGTPEEVAGAALFLASDLSSYITGQILRVDGGM